MWCGEEGRDVSRLRQGELCAEDRSSGVMRGKWSVGAVVGVCDGDCLGELGELLSF